MSLQIPIKFSSKKGANDTEKNFIFTEKNLKIFSYFEDFFKAQNDKNFLILLGEKYSGKSSILKILSKKIAQKKEIIFLNNQSLKSGYFNNFIQENNFYILDDFDKIENEETLFHLYNSIANSKGKLVLAGEIVPKYELKDLNSRISNIEIIKIENLKTPEEVKEILAGVFAQKQIKISNNLIDFISKNIERSYERIFEIVQKIEEKIFEKSDKISLQEVKEIIF
jgi:chromosomal replication initiation ATPase DnaA